MASLELVGNLTKETATQVADALAAAAAAQEAAENANNAADAGTAANVISGPLTGAALTAAQGEYLDSKDLPADGDELTAVIAPTHTKAFERVTPEDHGAVGNGTADDSAAFAAALSNVLAILRQGYRLKDVVVDSTELRGEHLNRLRSADATKAILRMRTRSAIDNVTIDGENATTRKIDIGDAGAVSDVSIRNVTLIDCPSASTKVYGTSSAVRMVNIYASNSKVFNTEDTSNPKHLLFSGIIVVNGPYEAFLLDMPGSTPDWTGFSITNSSFEQGTSAKRCIGIARAVGGVVTGNVFNGAYNPTLGSDTGDLLHIEDKAEMIAVVGNVFRTNGTAKAVDAALNGDITYPQADRDPKGLLFTSNLYRATDAHATTLMWLEGSAPEHFEKVTITGEHLECGGFAAPLRILAKSGVYGGNAIYQATAPERVRAQDQVATDNSRHGVRIMRRRSFHVDPKYLRGLTGHGYSPDEVLFKTSFPFASYTAFQTWAGALKSASGAAIFASGGSLGGGTVAPVVDTATGALFLRATRGASDLTTRLDFTWTVQDIDFQNLDNFCVLLQTRSSAVGAGRVVMSFPSAGPSAFDFHLNEGSDYASWKVDGASKIAPTTANFLAAGAGTIKAQIYLGDGLVNPGDYCDFGLIAVSHLRASPY